MRILAICGSIRSQSSNLAILEAAKNLTNEPPKEADPTLAPGRQIEIVIYDGLADLPYFNPDLDFEGATPPPSVAKLRALLDEAGALLISSPEYAHGIPGVLKNALDWLVSSPVVIDKPVGLISGSASDGSFAQQALIEVLRTMSARLVSPAIINIQGVRKKIDANGQVTDPHARESIRAAVIALREAASPGVAAQPGNSAQTPTKSST